ncbi:MAG: glycosyltransferase family 87 protein [Anaerolineae bacterium]|nr:glycosyltransferase family 87 protein [Anaerolineae bacterium]
MKRYLIWLLAPIILGLMWVSSYLPIPARPHLDFQVLYYANLGLLRGIALYDHISQVGMLAELAAARPEQVNLHPFPYPPWYALSTLPLAMLPISVAARFWLQLNFAMLMLAVWFLTEGLKPGLRLATFPLSVLFLPVLGALFVGQYVFPVLLGLGLVTYALRQKKPYLIVLGVTLLTFKPHLGILLSGALIFYLFQQKSKFSSLTLRILLGTGIFLFIIGYLADPAWPAEYFRSLTSYQDIAGVQSCDLCVSLPLLLAQLVGMQGFNSAFLIAGILMLILIISLYWKREFIFRARNLIVLFVLITMLVSPYLLNYDYVLLLVPFAWYLSWAKGRSDWIILGLVYILPWVGLGLFGRQGNQVLLVSTVGLALLLWQKSRKNQTNLDVGS